MSTRPSTYARTTSELKIDPKHGHDKYSAHLAEYLAESQILNRFPIQPHFIVSDSFVGLKAIYLDSIINSL